MRASNLVFGLLTLTLVATVSPPVGATPAPPKAKAEGIIAPDDFGNALVVVWCTGTGPIEESARVVVECDLYDSSGGPSIHHERSYLGSAGACLLSAQGARMPVEYCATITVTYSDLSQQSDTLCGHFGETLPPHNPPPPFTPTATECFDVVRFPA